MAHVALWIRSYAVTGIPLRYVIDVGNDKSSLTPIIQEVLDVGRGTGDAPTRRDIISGPKRPRKASTGHVYRYIVHSVIVIQAQVLPS